MYAEATVRASIIIVVDRARVMAWVLLVDAPSVGQLLNRSRMRIFEVTSRQGSTRVPDRARSIELQATRRLTNRHRPFMCDVKPGRRTAPSLPSDRMPTQRERKQASFPMKSMPRSEHQLPRACQLPRAWIDLQRKWQAAGGGGGSSSCRVKPLGPAAWRGAAAAG